MAVQLQPSHPHKTLSKRRMSRGQGMGLVSPYSSSMEETVSWASQQTSHYNSFTVTGSWVHLWSNRRGGRMGSLYWQWLTMTHSLVLGPPFPSILQLGTQTMPDFCYQEKKRRMTKQATKNVCQTLWWHTLLPLVIYGNRGSDRLSNLFKAHATYTW